MNVEKYVYICIDITDGPMKIINLKTFINYE